MRFWINLPGPFGVSVGRSARGQARRNLAVRDHERRILAERARKASTRRRQDAWVKANWSWYKYVVAFVWGTIALSVICSVIASAMR